MGQRPPGSPYIYYPIKINPSDENITARISKLPYLIKIRLGNRYREEL